MADEKKSINMPVGLRLALARALLRGIPPDKLLGEFLSGGEDKMELIDATNVSVPEGMNVEDAVRDAMGGKERQQAPRRAASYEEVTKLNVENEPPLKVGERVRWRAGMRNANWPAYGEVCVVSQVREAPVSAPIDDGSATASHRNNIALAFCVDGLGDDNYIDEFMYDSRRFERVAESLNPTEESNRFLRQVLTTPLPEAA